MSLTISTYIIQSNNYTYVSTQIRLLILQLFIICCSSRRLSISHIRPWKSRQGCVGFYRRISEHAGDTACINGHEFKAKFTVLSTSRITHGKLRQGRWRGRRLSAMTKKEIEATRDTIVVARCIKKRRHRREYDTFWLLSDKGAAKSKRDD